MRTLIYIVALGIGSAPVVGVAAEPVEFVVSQLVGGTIPRDQRPEYPPEARQSRLTGSGVFVLNIDAKDGKVTSITTKKSTGNRMLDQACYNALRKWRFKPNTVTKVQLPITFLPPR